MYVCIHSKVINGANGQNVVLSFWWWTTYSVGGTERVQKKWYADIFRNHSLPESITKFKQFCCDTVLLCSYLPFALDNSCDSLLHRLFCKTRKLSCHKDNRMMSLINWCPENFWESLSTPTATFAEIFNGLLFRSILWMCVENLKCVALPVPEIIGVLKKTWAVSGYAHAPFSPKFLMDFCLDGPCECIGIGVRT